MNKTIIKIKNLTMKYEGNIVFENLSFDVEKGKFISIIGENGCGKTTLMKAILGLKKPVSGSVEFVDLSQKDIGYLPQQTDIQKNFPALVKEIVVSDITKELENISYKELSKGQKQTVLLARAIENCRKLLVLDEPATSLDPNSTENMYKLIKQCQVERNNTIIQVSHDIDNVLKYSDYVLHLCDDGCSFFGTVNDYLISDTCKKFV
jgi:zinc transport system ATP-binding protein